jgi:hypothetical protein
MSSLKDSIAPLESDLKAVPPRISVYHVSIMSSQCDRIGRAAIAVQASPLPREPIPGDFRPLPYPHRGRRPTQRIPWGFFPDYGYSKALVSAIQDRTVCEMRPRIVLGDHGKGHGMMLQAAETTPKAPPKPPATANPVQRLQRRRHLPRRPKPNRVTAGSAFLSWPKC